jgi:acetoin utilization deacetylase AcuC-like enzyme
LQEHGAEKIAIVDIDLHHGNGTQDIFYTRDDVLFISTHQHPLYPGTGMLNETGSGPGAGATLNVPLPPFSGDRAFAEAMRTAILPALRRFEPDMLLVSAGMDAHWRDPLGHLLLTAGGYHDVVRALREFAAETCRGRIMLVLEGGYDLTGGASCASAAVSALLGRPYADDGGACPQRETEKWVDVLESVQEIHGL